MVGFSFLHWSDLKETKISAKDSYERSDKQRNIRLSDMNLSDIRSFRLWSYYPMRICMSGPIY